VLGVRTLNLIKTNILEKGLGQVLLQRQFIKAIDKNLKDISFDVVLYSTPPITLNSVVKHLKKRNPSIVSYLMLKDIFPQNAVDLGMMGKTGMKGMLYYYFRRKERELYQVSDYIGCMSPANVEYVVEHNPDVNVAKVEVAPNSIELRKDEIMSEIDLELKKKTERNYIRCKYNIPTDKPVFIYGGSLGKPQGVDFIVDCFDVFADRKNCYFLIVGAGVEAGKLKNWINKNNPENIKMVDYLPKEDYDMLVCSCDVGLIFLDHRFTIPNYPSRLLSYLEYKMPVLCATDPNTDVGKIAEKNGYGYWCVSNSVEAFTSILDKMICSDRKTMGEKGYDFLMKNYTVEKCYQTIIKHIKL